MILFFMPGHRRSIRLKGFDYSDKGFYFVTICCQDRENIFGEIVTENKMILNDVGIMVEKIVLEYFNKNKFFELDEYILMPDHIHMIVIIKNKFNNVGAGLVPALNDNINMRAGIKPAPTNNKTLGMIIGELKSLTTNEYIKNVKTNNWPKFDKRLWQRNYPPAEAIASAIAGRF